MSKKLNLVIATAVSVAVLGVVGYFVLQNNTDSNTMVNTAESDIAEQSTNQSGDTAVFDVLSTSDRSFEATMTGRAEREFTALMLYDGAGNSSYSADYGEGQFTMYRFGTEHISCYNSAGCFRLPDTDGDGNASEVKYDYSQDEINDFSKNATYHGTAACGDENCSVWEVASDGFSGTFYIDSNKRIKKVESDRDGISWTIVFTYKSVTIERPANVIDSPLL